MKKRILITGGNGYIGKLLRHSLSSIYEVDIAFGPSSQSVLSIDLTNKKSVRQFFTSRNYDVVINCAGTKDFNICNNDPERTVSLNCHIVENLLQQMSSQCQFIHISSDYVFPPNMQTQAAMGESYPDTLYGESKLIAEHLCRMYNNNYVIVRVAGVYSHNGGFFAHLIDNYRKNEIFSAFSNWYYSPLYQAAFIEGFLSIIDNELSKQTLNLVGEKISRYNFAKEVLEQGHFNPSLLTLADDPKHEVIDRSISLSSYFSTKNIRYLSHKDAIKDAMKKYYENN